MIKVLLDNQKKILINTFRTQPRKNYISHFFTLAVLTVLLYFLSKGVWAIGESISEPVLHGILSYGFLMIIGIIILLGLPQVFKHLYSATDLGLLFTLPIPTRHIFWVKYMQSFIGIPLLVFTFFVVPLFIYGILTGASLLYYPVMILVVTSLNVIGLSLAYLFNLILIQVVPASKANEFMTIMSVLSGIFVYLMFMIPNLANDRPLTEVLLSGLPLFPDWVPVSWGSAAVINATSGSMDFLLPFALIMLLAVFSVVVTSSLVEKGFRTGWIRLSEGGAKKKKKSVAKKSGRKLHHPVIAVGKKEWFAIKRDMREWLVFLPLIFFFIFGIAGFVTGGASLSDLRGPNKISWPIAQAAFLFIFAIFNGQLAASSIAREASSLWILRVLPLSGKNIAFGKLWISWLIPFALLTVLEVAVGAFLGWTILQFAIGIAMKAVITVGISAIGLWLGTIGAKYNPANPQNRLKFGTAFILFIASYVYLFMALIPYVLLIVPVDAVGFLQDVIQDTDGFIGAIASVVLTLLSWKASSPLIAGIAGVTLMLVISLGVAYMFTIASARKFDKGIEIEMVQETNTKSLFKNKKSGSLY
ncbi:putative ABC transporter permease subunit [Virgibacillus sp. L01]|uniref:putative ABC transporter permease subunit n=1 Tax=Virgibacillus sp. L01 TaxID=3457429 RepID=UPI003FD5BF70